MKFDVVVGNPPYDKGLHLKILAEVMKYLSDKGEIVWLAPINKYQKNKVYGLPAPVETTCCVEKIPLAKASEIFNMNIRTDIGFISNDISKEIEIVDNIDLINKLKTKLSSYSNLLFEKLENTFGDYPIAFGVGVQIATNGGSTIKSGPGCMRVNSYKFESAIQKKQKGHTKYLNCKSLDEQHRIWSFYQNLIFRFLYKEFGFGGIPYDIIPYYEPFFINGNWSLEKIVEQFEISNSELKYIFNKMKPYLFEDEVKSIEDIIKD